LRNGSAGERRAIGREGNSSGALRCRCARACGQQGMIFFLRFTARLKPCPDTCMGGGMRCGGAGRCGGAQVVSGRKSRTEDCRRVYARSASLRAGLVESGLRPIRTCAII
jgi:hypothetical protein